MAEDDAAQQMLAKLKAFVSRELDEEERALLAVLLAPGVAMAYNEDDTFGFSMTTWRRGALPAALADAVRSGGITVVGLTE
jgi:hypothetical protein